MFSEIVELVGYAVKAFDNVGNIVKGQGRYHHGWRSLFDLYRSIDTITRVAEKNFRSLSQLNLYRPDTTVELNESLVILSRSIKTFMKSFRKTFDVIGIYDEELRSRLEICLHMKSLWYKSFASIYSAGRIDRKTKKITKKTLKMSFDLEQWCNKIGRSYYDIAMNPEFLKEVTIEQEIDISTEEMMKHLVVLGRRNVEELNNLKDILRTYIVENCTLKDLLSEVTK